MLLNFYWYLRAIESNEKIKPYYADEKRTLFKIGENLYFLDYYSKSPYYLMYLWNIAFIY